MDVNFTTQHENQLSGNRYPGKWLWDREMLHESTLNASIVSVLAENCCKQMQRQSKATPTAEEEQNRQSVVRVIVLLLQNGARVADKERINVDALTSLRRARKY